MQGILISKKHFLYPTFLGTNSTYYIIVFEKVEDNLPKLFYHKTNKNNEILILEDIFAFYKNNKLIFFQKNHTKLAQEQIVDFAKNVFKMTNLEVVYALKHDKTLKTKYRFLSTYKSRLFKFFILNIFIVFFIIFYNTRFQAVSKVNSIQEINQSFEKIKEQSSFYSIARLLNKINTQFKELKLKLINIQLLDKTLKITTSSKKEENIYSFLERYNSTIENISYDEKKKVYKVNASFKIYRK